MNLYELVHIIYIRGVGWFWLKAKNLPHLILYRSDFYGVVDTASGTMGVRKDSRAVGKNANDFDRNASEEDVLKAFNDGKIPQLHKMAPLPGEENDTLKSVIYGNNDYLFVVRLSFENRPSIETLWRLQREQFGDPSPSVFAARLKEFQAKDVLAQANESLEQAKSDRIGASQGFHFG